MLTGGSGLQFQNDSIIEEERDSFSNTTSGDDGSSKEENSFSKEATIRQPVEEKNPEDQVLQPVIDEAHPDPELKPQIEVAGSGTEVAITLDASAGNFPELVNELKRAVKNKIDGLGSGALEFKDAKDQIDKTVKTFLARIPDNDAGNQFAQVLNSLTYHSGKKAPAGRTKIGSFSRKESIEEIIKGSKVKSEDSDIVLWAGIGLIALIALK